MTQEISFEQWKQQLIEGIQAAGYTPDLDDDLLFMAYDMEGISVEDAINEYITSYSKIAAGK
jgi:hypothetical protein